MRVILEVVKGPHEGEQFEFARHDTFMVGRSRNERVHFKIPDDRYFSRYHFLIEANPEKCFLRDLGSTNGTYINNKDNKVRETFLTSGDVILAGRTRFRIRIEEDVAVPIAPEPDAPGPESLPPDEADSPSNDVDLFPRAPTGSLSCAVCGKLAEHTRLGDLTDTRMITYVCHHCRDQAFDEQHPIPNYEKLGQVGHGALGPVYKARRLSTGVLVALKVIPPELSAHPQAVKHFLREMQLTSQLEHPNIVPTIEMGEAGGQLWIATEFVDGLDAERLAEQVGGTVLLPDAVGIMTHVLGALDYAHGLNLVHRDVKPSNIMVTGSPGTYVARLADFGLLRNMDEAGMSQITRAGEAKGTVKFMPPEQIIDCRFVKPAGDIYEAGATLYWLLTGEYVYDFKKRDRRGEQLDPFLMIIDEKIPIVPIRERDPSIPEPAAKAIETALAHDPEDRYDSAIEMARALERAIS